MGTEIKAVAITAFYPPDGIGGDYYSIGVYAMDGTRLAHYGDYYHDKGEDRSEGFVEGLSVAYGRKIKVYHFQAELPEGEYAAPRTWTARGKE